RVDTVRAEIADRERPALDIGGTELARLRAGDDIAAVLGELRERQCVGTMDHRYDEAVVDGHGEADVDLGMLHERAVLPRHVDARMLRNRRGDETHEEIRVADLRAAVLARLGEPRCQATDIHLADQEEVRHRRPRRRHALGHDAPDVADALSADYRCGAGGYSRCGWLSAGDTRYG